MASVTPTAREQEHLVPIPDDEDDDESDPEPANGDPPYPDQEQQKKAYIAVDGITHDQISEEDQEVIEKRIINYLLTNGYPITGARFVGDDAHVVEVERTDE